MERDSARQPEGGVTAGHIGVGDVEAGDAGPGESGHGESGHGESGYGQAGHGQAGHGEAGGHIDGPLARAFEQVHAGLALTTLRGEVLLVNHHLRALLGDEAEDIIGAALREVRDKLDADGRAAFLLQQRLAAHAQVVLEGDGSPGWLLLTAMPNARATTR